ncbi:1-deoxy-D-xylulose-5-phosphate synthase [Altibacter sp. HG106]|uniref:1-deoxy-D-xylulose-5-phosphate synthase n=1 Tax=Altibacter sp. HG106 TaxID=3023937 RepID=UPI0023500FB8|nr:1-deoxy-D-xylulose-5-phosphate synthase [Altibacter sp. HG106]MDC7994764.1 1-deoxy-D-xylulose-5-phosphate synthase [Altibacter sp. HG106]
MSNSLLHNITDPKDLRKLSASQLPQLAEELRRFIIEIVATKEGHLGASLGVVELTIALHYLFDTPRDLLVWDVGHQAYGHKIITGRREVFHTNRQLGGISGFPKRSESEYDTFGTGHSSTAISAALGMATAAQLKGDYTRHHIAVVGDASIASGMAFEALNHAGVSNANLLVILNDNAIGIDPSVGALKEYFLQATLEKHPKNSVFEAFNFDYSGPIDGHNLPTLLSELNRLKNVEGPKLLHINTKKGKGLKQAEEQQITYHAPGKFDAKTGDLLPKQQENLPPKFQDVFGKTLVTLAATNENIVGITPAMPTGSSLKLMMDAFPDRAFDVGIAEQHAVTFAAGLATQGMVVFCTIYSTFLQRAYDQVIHDVCLQDLPVIFCLDRAGLVGQDGATHHGIFDIAALRCLPNLVICAPRNEQELRNIMYTAQLGLNHPIAIRYPRGRGTTLNWEQAFQEIVIGKGECLQAGNKIAVLSLGTMSVHVSEAIKKTNASEEIGHYDLRFVKPLDAELLHSVFQKYAAVVTVEDGVVKGGVGSAVTEFATEHHYTAKLHRLGIPDVFPEHGSVEALQEQCGISSEALTQTLKELLTRLR